jgi:hypothetical protein
MPAGAASPEELEGMLEDACLLNDTSFLPILFDVDAVLLARGNKPGARARRHNQCDHQPASAWRQLRRRPEPGDAIRSARLDHLRCRNLGGPAKPGWLAVRYAASKVAIGCPVTILRGPACWLGGGSPAPWPLGSSLSPAIRLISKMPANQCLTSPGRTAMLPKGEIAVASRSHPLNSTRSARAVITLQHR